MADDKPKQEQVNELIERTEEVKQKAQRLLERLRSGN